MNFSDIRAYPEAFFKKYWQRITRDPHFTGLIQSLGSKYQNIKTSFLKLRNWKQFRSAMVNLVDFIIDRTTDGISYSGLENIPSDRPAVFISNHRSTSLDPVLFNHMLYKELGETAYNAAGDNLLNTPWLGHLIRLNRGFIVKRNVEDMDEKLLEAQKLSSYIRKLNEKNKHVWIAQRNGRAKDGNDSTDSAVLAMIKMAHPEKNWEELSEAVAIIPVSVSYEEIPLDVLLVKDHMGMIDESDTSRDSNQVVKEISQKKRRIHIHVSPAVKAAKRSELVKGLDREIAGGIRLWESNFRAAELLGNLGSQIRQTTGWFHEKIDAQEPKIRQALLQLYAAPVLRRRTAD